MTYRYLTNESQGSLTDRHKLRTVANADTAVIGILGYFWPRGFDAPNSVGSRDLPTSVLDEHERIGEAITEK